MDRRLLVVTSWGIVLSIKWLVMMTLPAACATQQTAQPGLQDDVDA